MPTTTPTDTKMLWKEVLAQVEGLVSKAIFRTWFKDTHIVRMEEGVVYVGVPNLFAKDWLASKYHKTLLKILRTLSENIRSVEYIISTKAPEEIPSTPLSPSTHPALSGELPLRDLYINKVDNLNPRYTFETFVVG